jgi:hypothetical protein
LDGGLLFLFPSFALAKGTSDPSVGVVGAVIVGPNGDVKVETARLAAEHLPPETLALFDKLLPLPPGVLTTVPRSAYAIRVEPRGNAQPPS